MKEEDVAGLRVANLKEELKSRGLAVSGLKAALAERLVEALREENAKGEGEKGAAEEPGKDDEDILVTAVADDATAADMKTSALAVEEEAKPADEGPSAVGSAPAGEDGAKTLIAADKQEEQGAKDTAAAAEEQKALEDAKAAVPASELEKAKVPEPTEGPPVAEAPQEKEEAPPADEACPPQPEESPSPMVRGRDSNAEREAAPAPAPVAAEPAAEEEVDYDADEPMPDEATGAAAPAEPPPTEARPPRARSESKSAAEERPGRSRREHADRRETSRAGKDAEKAEVDGKPAKMEADKADGAGKRKREPIPAFKPRERKPAEEKATEKEKANGRDAKIARAGGATDKQRASVFERLNSGAGKDAAAAAAGEEAAAAAPRRAPPSRDAASRALLITGFIRPFTERQAREKLSETGEITGFWMTKIKDRAFVVYAAEEQAEATRHAVSGLEWPPGNGNSLRPKFVPLEEAEETIKSGVVPENRMAHKDPAAPAAAAAAAAAKAPAPASAAAAAAAAAAASNSRVPASRPTENGAFAADKPLDARAILEERRRVRESGRGALPQKAAPAAPAAPEPMEVDEPKSLDDLFRKTAAKPWLYWLPLSEEQAAQKARRDAAALPGPRPSKK